MVLDTAERVASFHALDYDVEACRQALLERGLPANSCHLRRSRRAELAVAVRRALRAPWQR
jgi:hypothetical protein